MLEPGAPSPFERHQFRTPIAVDHRPASRPWANLPFRLCRATPIRPNSRCRYETGRILWVQTGHEGGMYLQPELPEIKAISIQAEREKTNTAHFPRDPGRFSPS
jgi:hypothetical protein